MLKFDVTIDFTGAKLHAIKTIRSALDIGLKEAKDATERFGTDTTYTTITLNAAQFANLYWFVQEENWRLNSDSYAITKRQLVITTVNRYEEPDKNVFDFSGLFQPLS